MSNGRTHPKELNSAPGIISKEIPFLEKTKYGVIKCQSRSRQRELIESFVSYPNSIFTKLDYLEVLTYLLSMINSKNAIWKYYIDPHEKIEIFNGVHFIR